MTDLDVSQMTPEQRLKQIEILLSTAAKSIVQGNERMDRLEQNLSQSNERMDRLEQNLSQSNERMDRLEQNLTLISDLVWSTARVVAEQREDIERIWRYLMS